MSQEDPKDDAEANRTATKADIERVIDAVENARVQDSLEHGSIQTTNRDQNVQTRAHIGSEVGTVRNDQSVMKTRMGQVVNAIRRFLERHGMKSDDLD